MVLEYDTADTKGYGIFNGIAHYVLRRDAAHELLSESAVPQSALVLSDRPGAVSCSGDGH
jgi:hypothetical protein